MSRGETVCEPTSFSSSVNTPARFLLCWPPLTSPLHQALLRARSWGFTGVLGLWLYLQYQGQAQPLRLCPLKTHLSFFFNGFLSHTYNRLFLLHSYKGMLPIIFANSCMVLCIVRLILGSLYSLSWFIVRGVALWAYSKWVSLCPTADSVLIDLGGCLIVYSILVCFQVCSWTLCSTTYFHVWYE